MPSEQLMRDLYWAAGFLEGDGCFSIGRNQPVVHASQKTKEPLERLQQIFGHGNITKATYVILNDRRPRNMEMWQWRINSNHAAAIMMTLYSMLSSRRQQRIREILNRWRVIPTKRKAFANRYLGAV